MFGGMESGIARIAEERLMVCVCGRPTFANKPIGQSVVLSAYTVPVAQMKGIAVVFSD